MSLEKKVICDLPSMVSDTPMTMVKEYCGKPYALGTLVTCDKEQYEKCKRENTIEKQIYKKYKYS